MDETMASVGQVKELPLVAQLIQANLTSYQVAAQRERDGLQLELHRRRAELQLVTQAITELVSGDVMPTPWAILRALYPARGDIDGLVAEWERNKEAGDHGHRDH